jgi:hypothetical protein
LHKDLSPRKIYKAKTDGNKVRNTQSESQKKISIKRDPVGKRYVNSQNISEVTVNCVKQNSDLIPEQKKDIRIKSNLKILYCYQRFITKTPRQRTTPIFYSVLNNLT